MKRGTLAAGVLVASIGIGGAAWAAAGPSTSTDVDACYRTTTGALRVDTGSGCRTGESSITLGTGQMTTRVVTDSDEMSWNDQGVVYALCDAGEVVVGGGYTIDNIGPMTFVNMDQPFLDPSGVQGWMIMATYTAFEDDGYVGHVTGWAICTPGVTTQAPWFE